LSGPLINSNDISYNGTYGICSNKNAYPEITSNEISYNLCPLRISAEITLDGNTYANNINSYIELIPLTVNDDTIWRNEGLPYLVIDSGNIYIMSSVPGETATVTVEPGVKLLFLPNTGIYVGSTSSSNLYGALVAQGTVEQQITFTAQNPSANWEGIYFRDRTNDAKTILEYCTISYGGNINNANLYINIASPTIKNSVISNSSSSGIIIGGISNPLIISNDISYNGSYGIYVSKDAYPEITSNEISYNLCPISISPEMNLNSNTYANNTNSYIEMIPKTVNDDTIWSNEGLPYLVIDSGNIYIMSSIPGETATVTVEPGVKLLFLPNTGIYVGSTSSSNLYGALVAQGTAEQQITFTAQNPSANWEGIYFRDRTNDAKTILEYCTISYGGNINNANLYINIASPTIKNSVISNSSSSGIIIGGISNPLIISNDISYNGSYGIYVSKDAYPEITSNEISYNLCPISISPEMNLNSNTYANNTNSYIEMIPKTVNDDTIWSNEGLPYLVIDSGNIYIMSSIPGETATVTVEPGVKLLFLPNTGIYVGSTSSSNLYGALVAQGTAEQQITFTAQNPSANWEGIYFRDRTNDAKTLLEHCIISYGGNINNTNLSIYNASPTIKNSLISDSSGCGIYASSDSLPTLTTIECNNNFKYPVSISSKNISKISQISGTGNTPNGIEIRGGNVTSNATWYKQDIPYIVSSNVNIRGANNAETATVTIEPGTELLFTANIELRLGLSSGTKYGALIAQGTVTDKIIFNAYNPLDNWRGLYFDNTTDDAKTILDYCIISCGGTTNNANLLIDNASPTIKNSLISDSSGFGIYASSDSLPTLTTIECINNANYPVSISSKNISKISQISGTGNTPNGIEIRGGNVTSNATWYKQDIPYIVSSNVNIRGANNAETATVTLEPGTELLFTPNTELSIGYSSMHGAIIARGTFDDKILFSANNPSAKWKGIRFRETTNVSKTILEYCIISHGGDTNNANLYIHYSSPTIRKCDISYSSGYGIISNHGNPVIQYCNILDNNLGGIYDSGSDITNSQYNWWGDISGPSGIGPGSGQSITGEVNYKPWLGVSYTSDFYIDNILISPILFSQNGGWCIFQLDISELSDWEIAIKDNNQSIVRQFSGCDQIINQYWYGFDDNLNPLLNGDYTYYIDIESVETPSLESSLLGGQLTLNNELPIAKINSPEPYVYLSQEFSISGKATGNNFDFYTLSYGIGYHPETWNTISTSYTPVDDGLLGKWNTTGLTSPIYSIRLNVEDSQQNNATDYVPLKIVSIGELANTPEPFSPNSDGIKDNTTLTAYITYPSMWKIMIEDLNQTLVKDFNGSSIHNISQDWDGKDNDGKYLLDGKYTYRVEITEPTSGVIANSVDAYCNIDVTHPDAMITYPESNGMISGTVEIVGTANDLYFESYRIEFGIGHNPTSWNKITGDIYTPVVNGLLGAWDVIDLFNGDYVIKLTVNDFAGNQSIINVPVIVDNIQITNVSALPSTLDPHIGETSKISYTIDRDAYITISIYDKTNNIKRILLDNQLLLQGDNSNLWDGTDDNSDILSMEAYYFHIDAISDSGAIGKYRPKKGSGYSSYDYIEAINPDEFDPYANIPLQIDFLLKVPCRTYIQVQNTPPDPPLYIRDIIVDEPFDIELYTVYWDGRDTEGNIYKGDYIIRGKAYKELPSNPIILKSKSFDICNIKSNPYLIFPTYGEVSIVSYSLLNVSIVSIAIYDPNANFVRYLLYEELQNQGDYEIMWDGKDNEGYLVYVEGEYRVEIYALFNNNMEIIKSANVMVYR